MNVSAVVRLLVANIRTVIWIIGLLMMHVGLRAVEPWAPGMAWTVPGCILVGVAIFGVRVGSPASQRRPS